MTGPPGILFTAFEPSGDAHAAPVIAELRRRRPQQPVWALGGPRMAAAGATLLETTTDRSVMLAGAATQLWQHRRRLRRLRRWLRDPEHHLATLVPVDSPAANWAICAAVRKCQPHARVVHLVAPQLWAWAPWRIRKLRRLSDHVLCLLPFEPAWFTARGVPATFVGHPALEASRVTQVRGAVLADAPAGQPRLALLPGSRHGEIKANAPTMMRALLALQNRHPRLAAAVATTDEPGAARVRQMMDVACRGHAWPTHLGLFAGCTEAVLAWADVVLVVSGTATLHVAAHGKPMVVLYNVNRWSWHLAGRWLVRTRTFTLPNLIAQDGATSRPHIVPELVPHFGAVAPVVDALDRLLTDPAARTAQTQALAALVARFTDGQYASAAADALAAVGQNPR